METDAGHRLVELPVRRDISRVWKESGTLPRLVWSWESDTCLWAKAMKNESSTLMKNGVRFRVLGNRNRLSGALQFSISQLEKATEKNDKLDLCIMLSYSGRWDILHAVQAIVKSGKKAEEIDYDTVSAALVTAGIPDPDLVIRTSGEKRISNYMLWQTAYSEFVFTDTLWPDFRKEELLSAIKEYSGRDRRFGKVK